MGRVRELAAMMLIGDGVVALLQPRRHSRLWKVGPPGFRRSMERFARRPRVTRALALTEVALGAWWASQQRLATR